MMRGKKVRKNATESRFDGEDIGAFTATTEQIALTNRLKEQRQPAIIPDTDFHDQYYRMKSKLKEQKISKIKDSLDKKLDYLD